MSKPAYLRAFFMSVLPLACLLLLHGCGQDSPKPLRFYAFGTLIEVTLPDTSADQKSAIESELIDAFQHWHDYWHPWQGDEGLAVVNRSIAADGRASVDDELAALIEAARPYYEQSDGLFDPAIGGLVRLWGFNQETAPDTTPAPEALAEWLNARPRYSDLQISNGQLLSENPNLQLDFGAFAKGYALDLAASLLKRDGIDNALINAGGDLIALGRALSGAGGRAWRVGIRHPRGTGLLAEVELKDGEALVTSGDYERFFIKDGKRYHHILDPRTGRPADRAISVSVLSSDAGRADTAATALFVAGADHWRTIAPAMGIDCAMLIDNHGRIHMTSCMQQRIRLHVDPEQPIIKSP